MNWLEFIKNKNILAHTEDSKPSETLEQHNQKILCYFSELKSIYGIDRVISNLCKTLNLDETVINQYIEKILLFHDIGKINPAFQKNILNNNAISNIPELKFISSHHSILSYFIFLEELINKHSNFINKEKEFMVICIIATCIITHHSDLQNIDFENIGETLEKVKPDIKEVFCYWDISVDEKIFDYIGKNLLGKINLILKGKTENEFIIPEKLTYIYFLFKLVNSLLITSDFYATLEYKTGEKIKLEGSYIDSDFKQNMLKNFHELETINGDRNFNVLIDKRKNELLNKTEDEIKNITDINELRNWLNAKLEDDLEKELRNNKKVFYLNLPTGAGKTNISHRLALKILEKDEHIKKLFYVFPFINIIEQSHQCLEKFVPTENDIKKCIRLDSKAPVNIKFNENGEIDDDQLKKIDFDFTFINYPVLFMSNVKFFDLFFRSEKNSNYNFYQLANSVVIIDEIQSYNDTLWPLLAEIIFKISKEFNIYFIIMSATLPDLHELVKQSNEVLGEKESTDDFAYLLKEQSSLVFEHKLFKRVKYNFDEIKESKDICKTISALLDKHIKNYHKILIIVNTISDSRKVYKELTKNNKLTRFAEVYLLNSTFLEFDRKRILEMAKNWDNDSKKLILVSTQTVEAGVDLDFDFGIRCYSPLDNIIQVAGRINRESKPDKSEKSFLYIIGDQHWSKVYTSNYKSIVSKADLKDIKRISNTLVRSEYETTKDFYSKIIEAIKKDNENFIMENTKDKLNWLRFMQFSELDGVRIIENIQNIPIFICMKQEVNKQKYLHIKELDKLLELQMIEEETENLSH